MHMCFRGGSGDSSRVARPISAIRGFTKSMKAMSLKAKPGGRSRRRRPEDVNPGAASAKITPAQLHDEADDEDHHHQQKQKQKPEFCDKCCSPLPDDDGREEEDLESGGGGREWVAEPEPGVVMTLAARRDGTNRLRRVRFRAELFDAWAARAWWADNRGRIAELYSVACSDSDDNSDSAMPGTPCHSEDEEEPHTPDHETTTPGPGAEESGSSPSTSAFSRDPSSGSGGGSAVTVGSPVLGLVVTAPNDTFETPPRPTATTESAQHDDDGDDNDEEWVEEYEPGVFLTVRACADQSLQLRHVELSRERFGEVKARVWWQENKDRLRTFYSF